MVQECAPNSSEIQLLLASSSVALRVQLLGSVATFREYVVEAGADAMEVTPQYSRLWTKILDRTAMLAETGTQQKGVTSEDTVNKNVREGQRDWSGFDRNVRELFASGHSGFRGDEEKGGFLARFFPRMRESWRRLAALQEIVGPMPVVLYGNVKARPDEPQDSTGVLIYNEINAPFVRRGLQLKRDEWEALRLPQRPTGDSADENAAFLEEVTRILDAHGFDEIVWDTAHSQEFDDPLDLLRLLLPLVGGMHLSLGRKDLNLGPQWKQKTAQARKAFQSSRESAQTTLEGEMLATVVKYWQTMPSQEQEKRRVVYEEMPSIFSGFMIGRTLRRQKAVLRTARQMLAGAVA